MPTTKPARPRIRLFWLAAASAFAIGASGLGTPTWTNVEIPLGTDGSIRIDTIQPGSFWGAAFAAARPVTLKDVTIDFAGVTYSAPSVTFTGVNLPQADIAA